MVLLEILLATAIVSLISLVGVVLVVSKTAEKNLQLIVSFAAGAMLAAAFLDLLPESLEFGESIFPLALFGFVFFFLLEKILFWHHHHSKTHYHPFAILNIFGDALHNFVDGTIIAASFIQGTSLGIATTLAVIAHEIPQEFGDFSVLIYSGMNRNKAIFYNFLVSLAAVAGALVMFYAASIVPQLSSLMLPFAAGGFLYIAGTDLIPEIKKEHVLKKSVLEFSAFLLGIAVIWYMVTAFG